MIICINTVKPKKQILLVFVFFVKFLKLYFLTFSALGFVAESR